MFTINLAPYPVRLCYVSATYGVTLELSLPVAGTNNSAGMTVCIVFYFLVPYVFLCKISTFGLGSNC